MNDKTFQQVTTKMGNSADVAALRFQRLKQVVIRLVWSKRLDVLKQTMVTKGDAVVLSGRVGTICDVALLSKGQEDE